MMPASRRMMGSAPTVVFGCILLLASVAFAQPPHQHNAHIAGVAHIYNPSAAQQQHQQHDGGKGGGAAAPNIRPLEIEHVYGCEGSTAPRHKTFNCRPGASESLTIRGHGFSQIGNTFLLQNAKTKKVHTCEDSHASRILPAIIQFCRLPADLEEGASYHLKAQNYEGQQAILRDAVTVKAAKAAEEEEVNLRSLDLNDWEGLGIGGLGTQFEELFRRAFGTRLTSSSSLTSKLNVRHVKGFILHGPPGTGKTLIARTVAKLLNAKNVQVVNGPEIMSKFVGESEKNLRALFADAEAEYKKNGEASGLHVIIFDEVDAVLRHRGGGDDSAARAVYDGVTTQMLAYMDGFNAQNNLIIIGLTNRLDALDKALLRPGRFEVQIRIPLPDDEGRRQIFLIHTKKMRDHGVLADDVDMGRLARDTASFSGADIAGVVRSGLSFALQRFEKLKQSEDEFRVTHADMLRGIKEILATKGSSANTAPYFGNGIVEYSSKVRAVLDRVALVASTLQKSPRLRLMRFVIQGLPETGTTALAALAARNTRFSFVSVISPESLLGLSTSEKLTRIEQAFETAANVALGCIVLDKIESLIEFSAARGSYNSQMLQELNVLLNRDPALIPHQRDSKLLLILTTSSSEALRMVAGPAGLDAKETLKPLTKRDVEQVFAHYRIFATTEEARAASKVVPSIGIKRLIKLIDMARTRASIFEALQAPVQHDLAADTIASGARADAEPQAADADQTSAGSNSAGVPPPKYLKVGEWKLLLSEFGLIDDSDAGRAPTFDGTVGIG